MPKTALDLFEVSDTKVTEKWPGSSVEKLFVEPGRIVVVLNTHVSGLSHQEDVLLRRTVET